MPVTVWRFSRLQPWTASGGRVSCPSKGSERGSAVAKTGGFRIPTWVTCTSFRWDPCRGWRWGMPWDEGVETSLDKLGRCSGSEQSLLSLWSDRKVLKDEMHKDSYLQAPPSRILGDRLCGRVWLEPPCGRQECPCWTLQCSAESNYLCWYSLHGQDNWGLTSCRLSSWAMLNICYHDGKQAFL